MRYRLAILMLLLLLAMLPMMYLPAAPAPEPAYAILDIGPPRKSVTAEEHCKERIGCFTNSHRNGYLGIVGAHTEVVKLPSVARLKDVPSWLAQNIRVKEEKGGRRLRFTFRAGTRAEQVTILNTLLRCHIQEVTETVKDFEKALRRQEEKADWLAKAIKKARDPEEIAHLQKLEERKSWFLQKGGGARLREEITRRKQIAVIKWAK